MTDQERISTIGTIEKAVDAFFDHLMELPEEERQEWKDIIDNLAVYGSKPWTAFQSPPLFENPNASPASTPPHPSPPPQK